MLGNATIEALPGARTRVTIHLVFQRVADREGMLESGIETGASESHARLDEILARLQWCVRRRGAGPGTSWAQSR